MADRLTEKIKKTLIENGASQGASIHGWRCGYPDLYGECDCLDVLAADLVATFRQHRMNLPVIRKADQRIEQEIRERGRQINARKHPIAFLASLRKKASHE